MQRRSLLIISLTSLLACLIIWNTVSIDLLAKQPVIASKLRPGSELVLAKQAKLTFPVTPAGELLAEPARLSRAKAIAREAVQASPYTPEAIGMMLLATALSGNMQETDRVARSSPNIGRRDKLLHVAKVMVAASEGNPAQAVVHLDTLARVQQRPDKTLFPLFVQLLNDENFMPWMVELLQRRPLWRSRFLVLTAQSKANASPLAQLIDALAARNVKLDADDLATFFIVNRQNLPPADQLRRWEQMFGVSGRSRESVIRDGDFTAISGPPPYGWTIGGGANAKGLLEGKAGEPGDRQAVIISDGNHSRALIGQYLTAGPGMWQFAIDGWVKGVPNQPIRFQIRCIPSGATIADSRAQLNSAVALIRVAFEVPSVGCIQQDMQIVSEKTSIADVYEAYFDNARVSQRL